MKTIGIYGYKESDYKELVERLKQFDTNIKSLKDNQIEDDIDLYIFNVESAEEFENIEFDRPFIIVSCLTNSVYLKKSLKLGALDYIHKPFADVELTVKRIQRLLEKKDEKGDYINFPSFKKNDKLIDIEIKRASRGKYSFSLLLLRFEVQLNKETLVKLIDKMKTKLRESDSFLLYPDQNLVVMLPFADMEGAVVVAKKLIHMLSDIGYKSYCLGSSYPHEGSTRKELIDNLGKSINIRYTDE